MTVQMLENSKLVEPPTIIYPESDGQPLGETEFHVVAILHLLAALRNFFRKQKRVYVIADMFMYYQEGNPRANKAPDVMVIKGIDKRKRRIFKVWEEGTVPTVIIEVSSASTQAEDTGNKKRLYASLGVAEYYIFDPLAEYLDEQFIGYALRAGVYESLLPTADGSIFSAELGVIFLPDEDVLRVVDPQTGQAIPGLDEAIDRADQAAEQARQEAERADQAAAQARHEAKRADQAAAQARQEAERADVAEKELTRVRIQLEQLQAKMRNE